MATTTTTAAAASTIAAATIAAAAAATAAATAAAAECWSWCGGELTFRLLAVTTPEEWPNFEAKQKDLRLLLPPATTALAPYNNGCAVEACVARSNEREQPSLCHSNTM